MKGYTIKCKCGHIMHGVRCRDYAFIDKNGKVYGRTYLCGECGIEFFDEDVMTDMFELLETHNF